MVVLQCSQEIPASLTSVVYPNQKTPYVLQLSVYDMFYPFHQPGICPDLRMCHNFELKTLRQILACIICNSSYPLPGKHTNICPDTKHIKSTIGLDCNSVYSICIWELKTRVISVLQDVVRLYAQNCHLVS